jgi:hypothetical protein
MIQDYFAKIVASLDEYNKVAQEVKSNPKPKQQRPVSPPPLVITARPSSPAPRPSSPLPSKKEVAPKKKPTPSKGIAKYILQLTSISEAHLTIWGHNGTLGNVFL